MPTAVHWRKHRLCKALELWSHLNVTLFFETPCIFYASCQMHLQVVLAGMMLGFPLSLLFFMDQNIAESMVN